MRHTKCVYMDLSARVMHTTDKHEHRCFQCFIMKITITKMRFVLDIIIEWLALSFQGKRGPFESPWKTFHCCDGNIIYSVPSKLFFSNNLHRNGPV